MHIVFSKQHMKGSLALTSDAFINALNSIEGVRAEYLPEMIADPMKDQPDFVMGIDGVNPGCFRTMQWLVGWRVGYGVWEASTLPEYYKRECSMLDLVFAPSNWCRDMILKQGVVKPEHIAVIPSGIDPSQFPLVNRKAKNKGYTILAVGWIQHRKGFDVLMKAFTDVSKDDGKMKLVIHGVPLRAAHKDDYKWLSKAVETRKDVVWSKESLSPEEMTKLFSEADLYVCPSRAEGFGLPPLEAMATGLPTIITNYSGMTDFISSDVCYPLKYTLKTVTNRENRDMVGAQQAEPDVDDLKRLIRHCYENQNEALDKGKAASKFVHENFTWKKSALKLYEFLKPFRGTPSERMLKEATVHRCNVILNRAPTDEELNVWMEVYRTKGREALTEILSKMPKTEQSTLETNGKKGYGVMV